MMSAVNTEGVDGVKEERGFIRTGEVRRATGSSLTRDNSVGMLEHCRMTRLIREYRGRHAGRNMQSERKSTLSVRPVEVGLLLTVRW